VGFVVEGPSATRKEPQTMPNHLTPEELSREFDIDRAEVIRICVEEHVPVYHGRIDKTLFEAVRLTHLEPLVHATNSA
jgi:hypothetical protein